MQWLTGKARSLMSLNFRNTNAALATSGRDTNFLEIFKLNYDLIKRNKYMNLLVFNRWSKFKSSK